MSGAPIGNSGSPSPAPPRPHGLLREHVRLACVPGIGSRMRKLLLDHFGSPEAVFAAAPEELRAIGRAGKKIVELIGDASIGDEADEVIDLCRRRSIRILLDGSNDYPPLLSRIDDPPGLLFMRGALLEQDSLAVAIVGARHATAYGMRIAEQLASSLARAGYTVVSGLARGIDAAAHRGAIAAGGRTIAVLGSGILSIYPPEHEALAEEVIAHGALLSELPPKTAPVAGAFPQRNRIVSGLSLGTVVVQASERSGALITARLAGEQGREVFAVPGPIDCRMSKGCHDLIRDGAKLVGGIDDILEELGPFFETTIAPTGCAAGDDPAGTSPPVSSAGSLPAERMLEPAEKELLDAIGRGGISIDEAVEATGLAASQVFAAVSMLEVRRLVRRLPGNRIERIRKT